MSRTHQQAPCPHWLACTALAMGIFGFAGWCGAGDFLVRNWDLEDGLPSTCINTMLRTDDGYLWVGTRNGLVRFDGLRIRSFNFGDTPAIKDNRVTCLAKEKGGRVWIGMQFGGLAKMEDGVISTPVIPGFQTKAGILCMSVDADDNLWFATDEAGRGREEVISRGAGNRWREADTAGLFRVRGGELKAFTAADGLSSPSVVQLLPETKGKVWYVTAAGRLGWVEGDRCHELDAASGPPAAIRAIAPASGGGLWVATVSRGFTGARLFKFKDGQYREVSLTYPWLQSSERTRIGALMEDEDGHVWCGTLGEGVFIWTEDGQWQRLLAGQPVSQAEVLCFVRDVGGAVLMGSRTSGFFQTVLRPLTVLPFPPGYSQEVFRSVCISRDGSLWAGTDGVGMFQWKNGQVFHFGEKEGLASLHVNAVMEDSHSRLWVGTGNGLFLGANGRFEVVKKPALQRAISLLYENERGEVLVGTDRGLVAADETRGDSNQFSGVPSGRISAMIRDKAGRLWITVEWKGVFRQNGGHFERWIPREGSSGSRDRWHDGRLVRALLPDRDGSVWAATYGDGLFRLEEDSITRWGWENDGIPSNHQFALLEDADGNLWFSSENGIFGYSKESLLAYNAGKNPRPVPIRLAPADGLPFKVCSGGDQPTAAKSSDGLLWFPNGTALVGFNPADIPRSSPIWPPVIERIVVDGNQVQAKGALPIQVRSGARSFEFHFTSPNILSPGKLRFRCKLEGLDKDWFEAPERSVRYGQLRPGDYTFRVMAGNNNESWNDVIAASSLRVTPRFWEMQSFQIVAGLLLLGSVALVVRRRERVRSQRKLAAVEHERALELERTRIARDIHDDLGASLTQVALLGDMAASTMGSSEELREQTRQISAAANDMAQSLEAIVWAVRPENDTLRSLVEYISRRTDELFEKMPRRYHFNVSSEIPECSVHAEVRHNVFLAYKEAITNALKHSQAANFHIEVSCDSGHCRINIADDGNGFDIKGVRVGGTGLKNMRVRLEEIGGHAEVQTKLGSGTTVRLQFPLRREGEA